MPEIDVRRNPWIQGYPREEQLVSREVYSLLAIFAASQTLAERRKSTNGGCVYSWSIQSFEYAEIGRILVSLAAMLRNDWDAFPSRAEQNLDTLGPTPQVGVLIPDIDQPAPAIPLALRDSFNKILHAHTLNLERSEGPSPTSGHLLPRVHLYGEHHGKQWKATLEIYAWAEVVHAIA
jgi:hypothetical protein